MYSQSKLRETCPEECPRLADGRLTPRRAPRTPCGPLQELLKRSDRALSYLAHVGDLHLDDLR
jgi:hypothetical protein